ncbi:hypothetical protein ACEWY4_010259 [Coilia grayii]|uniref:Uncharacterized protein n=1 Tax=Coilia grayii TaxID=363190 RepID=A0ABD1K1E5_9TELE
MARVKMVEWFMVFFILQWNARSLIANGQELKRYVQKLPDKPDMICIQETWLKAHLQFVIKGYIAVRCDRGNERGGGCITFIKDGIPYKCVKVNGGHECIVTEIFNGTKETYTVINYYNPCQALTADLLNNITTRNHTEIWCGDFNAHNSLWGSKHTDSNGIVVEEVINDRMLVCVNDGSGTRLNICKNELSCIDLTLVDRKIAYRCQWNVDVTTTIGSDHYPIWCKVDVEVESEPSYVHHKWLFHKANWEEFQNMSSDLTDLIPNCEQSVNAMNDSVSAFIYIKARESIPMSEGKRNMKNVPWWNDQCTKAIKDRNKALQLLRKTLTPDNLLDYQSKKALARRTIKEAKRESWRDFCRETSLTQVWMMIKKMTGRYVPPHFPVLKDKEKCHVTDAEKANILAKTFADVHKGLHLEDYFKVKKEETLALNIDHITKKEANLSSIDLDFSMSELKKALNGTAYSSPGSDGLCYAMFRQLPDDVLEIVLKLFNKVWNEGTLPVAWKRSTILPFHKPGKDKTDPGNYRPIALTSHLGKLMEKMVVARLTYYLEYNNLLHCYQTGFRKQRSTTDALIKLTNEIEKTLTMKEAMVAFFLDIEKAYDTMWREGLLIKLNNLGINGKMYNYILDFMAQRTLRVRIGEALSNEFSVEGGIPQGSVISPILFNIMINDIFEKLNKMNDGLLYADDAVLWKRGNNIPHITKTIQKELSLLEKWGMEWGFKFSVQKSQVMYFTRKKITESYNVLLYDQPLKRGEGIKYLGLWLDKKLNWKRHIEYLETKCKKVLNIMRMVSGLCWGADRQSLLNIYKALIRSNIDYGCTVYGTACKTSLMKLERVHSRALRIALGALKTTPISALQVESAEAPLKLRFDKLALTYWVRLQCSVDSPAISVLKDCWEYYNKGKGFGWTIDETASAHGLKNLKFSSALAISNVPPWILPAPDVNTELLTAKKDHPNDQGFATHCKTYLASTFYGFLIFTDGSKDPQTGQCGIGIFIPEFKRTYSYRLNNFLSIYSIELTAIIAALRWVEEVKPLQSVICTDSLSVLQSFISGHTLRDDLVTETMQLLAQLNNLGLSVHFCWVPAHMGLKGNETADKVAKEALGQESIIVHVPLGKGEAKSFINAEIMNRWQDEWEANPKGRHYFSVQQQVGGKRITLVGLGRREEVVYTRLRLGHAGINATLHVLGKSDGLCAECQVKEDVEHILFNCRKYTDHRTHWIEQAGEENVQNILKEEGMQSKNIKGLMKYLTDSELIGRI